MLKLTLAVLILVTTGQLVQGVSTLGKKFIVYPPKVTELWDRIKLYITTASVSPVDVQIQTPMQPIFKGGLDVLLTVSRDRPIVYDIPSADGTSIGSLDKLYDGIVVVAQQADIAVFVSSPGSSTFGVTSLLSYDSLGTRYLFPSIPKTYDTKTSILIGSSEEATSIQVTLPPGPGIPTLVWKNTEYGPGQTFTVTMNPNEFVNIRQQKGAGVGDLTGTVVESNNKVAVFSVSVFYPHVSPNAEPIISVPKGVTVEHVPPLGQRGSSYVVSAAPSSYPTDHIRVLAGENDVTVTFFNGSLATLKKVGDFLDDDLVPGETFGLSSDKIIQVVQYRSTFEPDSAPFLFHVPPVENFRSSYSVPILFKENPLDGTENHLVLMTHVCNADRVMIQHDRDPSQKWPVSRLLSQPWRPVANSSIVTSVLKVGLGFVTLSLQASDGPLIDQGVSFGGFFFGRGPEMAYAAPLGLKAAGTEGASLPMLLGSMRRKASKDGKSRLVSRGKLPLANPLTRTLSQSRVACHSECWLRSDCFFLSYEKALRHNAAETRTGDKGDYTPCTMYGITAQCSGWRATGPNHLLYGLDK